MGVPWLERSAGVMADSLCLCVTATSLYERRFVSVGLFLCLCVCVSVHTCTCVCMNCVFYERSLQALCLSGGGA